MGKLITPSRSIVEHVFNGNMELDSGWVDSGATTNVRSDAQAHSGAYSRKFTSGAAFLGIQSNVWTSRNSQSFFGSVWVYNADGTEVTLYVKKGDGSASLTFFGTVEKDVWSKVTFEYTEGAATGGPGAFIIIASLAPTFGCYVDDVSIVSQVTQIPNPLYKKVINGQQIIVTPDLME